MNMYVHVYAGFYLWGGPWVWINVYIHAYTGFYLWWWGDPGYGLICTCVHAYTWFYLLGNPGYGPPPPYNIMQPLSL